MRDNCSSINITDTEYYSIVLECKNGLSIKYSKVIRLRGTFIIQILKYLFYENAIQKYYSELWQNSSQKQIFLCTKYETECFSKTKRTC